tara:strand:- start:187 stop:297 length:111 start_codon:yes stop_codon:yes gene_type:complete
VQAVVELVDLELSEDPHPGAVVTVELGQQTVLQELL